MTGCYGLLLFAFLNNGLGAVQRLSKYNRCAYQNGLNHSRSHKIHGSKTLHSGQAVLISC